MPYIEDFFFSCGLPGDSPPCTSAYKYHEQQSEATTPNTDGRFTTSIGLMIPNWYNHKRPVSGKQLAQMSKELNEN